MWILTITLASPAGCANTVLGIISHARFSVKYFKTSARYGVLSVLEHIMPVHNSALYES
jgi:hypothetical protein